MAKALSSAKEIVVMDRGIVESTFSQIYQLNPRPEEGDLFDWAENIMSFKTLETMCLVYIKRMEENDFLNEKQLEILEIMMIKTLNALKGVGSGIPRELSAIISIDIDSYSLYNIEHRSNLLTFDISGSDVLYTVSKKLYETETIYRENNGLGLSSPFTELHKSFQKTHSISQKFNVVEEALYNVGLQAELIVNVVCNYLEGFGIKSSKTAISNYLLCCTNDQDPKRIVDTILEYMEEPSCVNYQGLVTLLDQYFCRDSISIFRSSPSNIKFLITEYTGIEPYYICDTPLMMGEESGLVEYLP